jgi:hypothetical protein
MSPHNAFRKRIATAALPALGPERRSGTLALDELNRALDLLFAEQSISSHAQPLLRSAALLWHDHLDASHVISQGLETREGSWLHGIMHRREPDYGNAKYWFRRVGQHDAFPKLAQRVAKLLHNGGGGMTKPLIEDGEWIPFAFVNECERAEQGNDSALTAALQQIQAAEFDVLVEHIFAHSM